MRDRIRSRVGGIPSADIAVPEHERESRFYARVLTTGKAPFWRSDLMNDLGMPIIGLGQQTPEYADLPLQWMPHVQVADVAASAERAVALGGQELMHGKSEDGTSQWAVLVDPVGAAFGIIPLLPADAVPAIDAAQEPFGCIADIELAVSDAAASVAFYREVIGWSHRGGASHDQDVHAMLGGDGHPAARIRQSKNADVPSVWMICLPVGDLERSLELVLEEGGEVLERREGDDGALAHATVRDPVGVCLALVQATS